VGNVTAISVSDSSSDNSVATLIMSEVLIVVHEGLIVLKRASLRQIRGGGRTENKGTSLPLNIYIYIHTNTHTYIHVYVLYMYVYICIYVYINNYIYI